MKLGAAPTVIYAMNKDACIAAGGIPSACANSGYGVANICTCTIPAKETTSAPAQNTNVNTVTVSPNIITQVSPSINPIFGQQTAQTSTQSNQQPAPTSGSSGSSGGISTGVNYAPTYRDNMARSFAGRYGLTESQSYQYADCFMAGNPNPMNCVTPATQQPVTQQPVTQQPVTQQPGVIPVPVVETPLPVVETATQSTQSSASYSSPVPALETLLPASTSTTAGETKPNYLPIIIIGAILLLMLSGKRS